MPADLLQPLMDALRSAWPQADSTSLATAADQLLRGQFASLGSSTVSLTFGSTPPRPGSGKGPAHE